MAGIFENDKCFIKCDMKLLLLVGSANDIFIYNYAKWLKASIDVYIDVFEQGDSIPQGFDNRYYDNVNSAKGYLLPLSKGKGLIDAVVRGWCLKKYLRGKNYDIIHSHWVVAPVVIQRHLKKHCKKLVLTFWGGEFEKLTILGSNRLYRQYLNKLSRQTDCIINSSSSRQTILGKLPCYKGDFKSASFGSAPLEAVYSMMQNENKEAAKRKMDMPVDKQVVLIGYSGKPIHRQVRIIRELHKYPELKEKIHLLAPMTRGASEDFVQKVEKELIELGFSYTLIKGKFLSDEEVARIRIATDIALQLSEWDGFSRSIIECLCAKSILIYGNWLGYQSYMAPSGFTGIEVNSVEEGVSRLKEIVEQNNDGYKGMTEKNSDNGRHQAIWSECIVDWVNAYHELLLS